MVVGHFLVVKNLLRLGQRTYTFLSIGFESQQRRHLRKIILDSRQCAGYFGIQILTQISRIDTRISGHAFLVQRLDQFQCPFRREGEFLVAIHLK